MASGKKEKLYLGVTNDIIRRAWQHKHGFFEGFSKQHGCHALVWYEIHDDISEAIYKEKQMKKWKRLWKLELIEKNQS